MNILFLNSLGKSKWGGGEKWMISAGTGLASKGHHITIACIPKSIIEKKSHELGLNTWSFTIPADIAIWKMPSLRTFLRKNKIDVLVCCQNKDVKIGAKAARQVGLNAIFARQGVQNLRNKRKYIKPFTEYIDGIITNTNSIKETYESFGWFPDNFIHVVYNGVEIPREVSLVNFHEKYKLPEASKIIFSAGRLDHQKGFDLLIEVARKVKDRQLNWQFIIAGEGKLKHHLISLTEKNNVSELVHFIGFSNNVPSLLKSSDVFVLPSRYEGMPNALLEAMAMGKASVATNVNGTAELVEEGISGFLVPSEHTDQLFTKLNLLLSNEKLRKNVESNALKRVEKYFTYEKMTDHLEQLFDKFLQH